MGSVRLAPDTEADLPADFRDSLPIASPDQTGLIAGRIVVRTQRGGGWFRLALVRHDHAADAVSQKASHDHVAGKMPVEGDSRGPNQGGGGVGNPGDPAVIGVDMGEDRGDRKGPGGMTGGKGFALLPLVGVVVEKLPLGPAAWT